MSELYWHPDTKTYHYGYLVMSEDERQFSADHLTDELDREAFREGTATARGRELIIRTMERLAARPTPHTVQKGPQ